MGKLTKSEAETSTNTVKPPLGAIRIICELLAGGIGGIIGLVLTSWLLNSVFSTGKREDWGALVALYILIFVGPIAYMLCSSIAVYLCGSIKSQGGSIGATFAGALIGGLVGIFSLIIWWISGKGSVISYLYIAIPGFLPAPVGATIAFNLTRKYRETKGKVEDV